ncbi:MAG: GntR family transcriptional regulator [Synergistaceae bacterium]|jgi:DNA-binding GntR family transcriptional regulator|nr:GntR family transcriptional regulator [Synergistaceae bacterium]
MSEGKKNLLYRQIEDYVITNIGNGTFAHDSRIPTEAELCDMFGVSRMTVNKALTNLSSAGYIIRVPGKGSFVGPHRVMIEKKIPEMISFSQELERMGIVPSSELIRYSVTKAGLYPGIARKLRVHEDELIHYFVRLRCGDGKHLALSYNYVLVRVVPSIDIHCLERSFYAYLEDSLGLELGYNDTVIHVVRPSEETKQFLGIPDGSDVVQSSHVSYLLNDEPFEYTETFYIPDNYVFRYRCYRNRTLGTGDENGVSKRKRPKASVAVKPVTPP